MEIQNEQNNNKRREEVLEINTTRSLDSASIKDLLESRGIYPKEPKITDLITKKTPTPLRFIARIPNNT